MSGIQSSFSKQPRVCQCIEESFRTSAPNTFHNDPIPSAPKAEKGNWRQTIANANAHTHISHFTCDSPLKNDGGHFSRAVQSSLLLTLQARKGKERKGKSRQKRHSQIRLESQSLFAVHLCHPRTGALRVWSLSEEKEYIKATTRGFR